MRKRYLAIVVALLVAISGAWATTVVYVTSSCGMAVGADGKTVPSGTAVKIALLKQRLVVADLYYESMTSGGAGVSGCSSNGPSLVLWAQSTIQLMVSRRRC